MKNEDLSSVEKKVTELLATKDLVVTCKSSFNQNMINQHSKPFRKSRLNIFCVEECLSSTVEIWNHQKIVSRGQQSLGHCVASKNKTGFGINTACLAWEAARYWQ